MRQVVILVVLMGGSLAQAGDDPKPEVVRLKRADLVRLAGTWEAAVEAKNDVLAPDGVPPKGPTKGTLRLHIELAPADAKEPDYLRIRWDSDLTSGNGSLKVLNRDPAGGPWLAGYRRGKAEGLAANKDHAYLEPPFELDVSDRGLAPFTLKDGKLVLDLNKSAGTFLPRTLGASELDWRKVAWKKVKK